MTAGEFRWPVRVYYEDTDAGGVVYHTGYIRFFERARTEWLRALGYSLHRLTGEEGVLFTVVDLAIRYRKPARLDDLLEVVTTADVAGASVLFAQAVHGPEGEVLAEGEVRVACVDAKTFRPLRMPDWLKTGGGLMSQDSLSILKLVLDASPVVQFVLVLLGIASIGSWSIIIGKSSLLARARGEAESFEAKFWSGGDLGTLYRNLEAKGGSQGMSNIFEMGFREFARLRQSGATPDQQLEGARRAMKVAQIKELDGLEHNLATLATIGSVSPYVGLFGTVWGIMSTFVKLGAAQQATLATVAPGISEALVATAFALVAAIPAFIAYNRYADKVSRLELRYNAFMEEFSTILQRHASRPPGAPDGISKP